MQRKALMKRRLQLCVPEMNQDLAAVIHGGLLDGEPVAYSGVIKEAAWFISNHLSEIWGQVTADKLIDPIVDTRLRGAYSAIYDALRHLKYQETLLNRLSGAMDELDKFGNSKEFDLRDCGPKFYELAEELEHIRNCLLYAIQVLKGQEKHGSSLDA